MIPNCKFEYLASPLIDGATINNICNIHKSNIENIIRQLLLQKKSINKSTIRQSAYNGKIYKIIVNIKIKYANNSNFTYVTMIVEDLTTNNSGYNRSGLSINELELNNKFSKFYPKNTDKGFIDYSDLYRSSEINTSYDFQKTYQGIKISQSQYLFGSQFTGALAKQVQYLLGSNDMDIKYRFDTLQSNGIYIDTFGDYWLITIGIDGKNLITSNGVWCRKLTLLNRVDDTVKLNNNVNQNPINLKLVDGVGFLDTDTKILNLSDIYGTNNNLLTFSLSLNQGFCFNSRGNKAINVIYSAYNKKFYTYEIVITEIKDNQGFVTGLSATKNLISSGDYFIHPYINFLQPKFQENSSIYPQATSIANYDQAKKGSLIKLIFPSHNSPYFKPSNISADFNNTNEYKFPLIVFYDEEDNIKTYYYYFKATKNTQEIISNTGFTNTSDFYKGSGIIEGDLIIKNQDYYASYSIKHGIMINDDESNLIIDNSGDYEEKYSFKINDGTYIDDFINQVENNTLSIDLRPYKTFYLENIDTYIRSIQYNTNSYEEQFKGVSISSVYSQSSSNTTTQLEYVDYYDIKNQLKMINDWLNFYDTDNQVIRLNDVIELKEINKIYLKDIVLPEYPPLLYKVNSNIKNVFDNLSSTIIDNVKTKLTSINDKINNQILSNADWYKRNILIKFKQNFLWLKNQNDYSKINQTQLKQLLADINEVITQINTIHSQINGIIDSINSDLSSINDYFTNIDILYNNCKDFYTFLSTHKGYKGLKLTQRAIVYTSSTTRDIYYQAEKYYYGKYTSEKSIKNAQYTFFTNIFNYSSRNDLTVYNQKNTFNNNFENNNQYKTYTSNIFAKYKKTQTFTDSSMTTLVSETDYIFEEEVINYKVFYVIDRDGFSNAIYIGNSSLDDGYTNIRYIEASQNDIHSLIQSDYSNIPKNYTTMEVSNYFQNGKYSSYDINYNSSIKVFSKEIININTNIVNDFRLITFPSYVIGNSIYYDYFNKDKYNLYYKGNGLTYFNLSKDAYTFNYTVSNGIKSYTDEQDILTNISKYNIINNKFVNFFGNPF